MKKAVLVLFFTAVSVCGAQNADAQLCIASDLKVSTICGVAIYGNGTILKNLPLKLSKDVLGETIINLIRTDENGEFSFGTLESGQYYVIVQNVEGLSNLTFRAKVKKKYGKKRPLGIKIIMYSLFDCSTAQAEIQNKG